MLLGLLIPLRTTVTGWWTGTEQLSNDICRGRLSLLRNDALPAQPYVDTLLMIRTLFLYPEFIAPTPLSVNSIAPAVKPDSGIKCIVNLLLLLPAPLWSMLTRGSCAPMDPATVNPEAFDSVRPAIMNKISYFPSAVSMGTTNEAEVEDRILQFPVVLFPNKTRHVELRMNFDPDTATASPRWATAGVMLSIEHVS